MYNGNYATTNNTGQMIVVPFEEWHFTVLDLQEKQSDSFALINTEGYAKELITHGFAWTVIHDNEAIACYGLVDAGGGRCIIWAFLSKEAKKYMLRITRYVLLGLNREGYARYEAHIKGTFPEARRWVEIMGFKCETPNGMANYANNETYYLYART